jgi:uncharacterized protein (UPF0262 family)
MPFGVDKAAMAQPRIIAIDLDERSILKRSADIERERRIAIFDLLEGNRFSVAGQDGPYRILLRVEEGRLAIVLRDEADAETRTIRIGLARLRGPIRDYFAICESYFRSVREAGAKGIESIDMARRALHIEAAGLLQDCLAGKVEMDFDTARRMFTLICVLHIRQSTTAVDLAPHGPASRAS